MFYIHLCRSAKVWCGGSFTASQIGVIKIPEIGPGTLYDDTIDCTWSINTLTDSVVLLWFIGMNGDNENVNICENRYLKVRYIENIMFMFF